MADIGNDDRLTQMEQALISNFGERAIIICSGQRLASPTGSYTQKTWGELERRLKAHFQPASSSRGWFLKALKIFQPRAFRAR